MNLLAIIRPLAATLAFACCPAPTAFAADPPTREFIPLKLEQADPDAIILEYVLVLPEGFDATRPYPTLLALPPGAQTREMVESGLRVWEQEAKRRGWVVISPTAHRAGTPSADMLFAGGHRFIGPLLDEVAKTVRFEGGVVHLSGISNGGRAAFRVAAEMPQRVASILVLPGTLSPSDFARTAEFARIPITMLVGGKDTEWVKGSQKSKDAIEKSGGKVDLRVVPNTGHAIAISPIELFGILESHRPADAVRAAAATEVVMTDELAIAKVLDAFHAAAAAANGPAYFDLFVPDPKLSVFIGTDATERWPLDAFRAFAKPYFDAGKGWTYTPRSRTITLIPASITAPESATAAPSVAYFDELLDNAKYGECRGTGVLVRIGDSWKIAQYNLGKPIPNDHMDAVLRAIKQNGP